MPLNFLSSLTCSKLSCRIHLICVLFNLWLVYQSYGSTNRKNRDQLFKVVSMLGLCFQVIKASVWDFLWGGRKHMCRAQVVLPFYKGNMWASILCSLALGTPRGVIWQAELLLLRVVWLASKLPRVQNITQTKCTACFNANTSSAHVLFAVWNVSGGIGLWWRFVLGSCSTSDFGVEQEEVYTSQCRSYPPCFQRHSTSVALTAIHIGCYSWKVKTFSAFYGLKRGVTWQLSVPVTAGLTVGAFCCFALKSPFQFVIFHLWDVQNSICSCNSSGLFIVLVEWHWSQ